MIGVPSSKLDNHVSIWVTLTSILYNSSGLLLSRCFIYMDKTANHLAITIQLKTIPVNIIVGRNLNNQAIPLTFRRCKNTVFFFNKLQLILGREINKTDLRGTILKPQRPKGCPSAMMISGKLNRHKEMQMKNYISFMLICSTSNTAIETNMTRYMPVTTSDSIPTAYHN